MTTAIKRELAVREWRDRRIIAALRFVDATTGGNIRQSLQLEAERSRFEQNLSGVYVLSATPGFESYVDTFNLESALEPVATTLDVNIQDPSGRYLPRQFSLSLPRDPASGTPSISREDSLFQPVRIALYPSTTASINPGWAVIRATVLDSANHRLPWALVRTEVNGTITLTQADWRGEALIAVPGIPMVTASDDELSENPTTSEFSADLEVVFNPALNFIDEAADFIGLSDPNPNYLPNPEQLNDNRNALQTGSETVMLTSGQDLSLRLVVTLT